jgi:hypothetical protein
LIAWELEARYVLALPAPIVLFADVSDHAGEAANEALHPGVLTLRGI